MKLTSIILYFLIGIWVAQFLFYFANLPETVASHYNAAGEADGWMSKNFFAFFELLILLIIIGEFMLLPRLIKKIPASMINLPNKTFWLAEERREDTYQTISKSFEWFAIILLIFFTAVNQLVFRANIEQQNLSSTAISIVIGAFFAAVILWMIRFISYFRKV